MLASSEDKNRSGVLPNTAVNLNWNIWKNDNLSTLYYRAVENSNLIEIKVTTTVKSSLSGILIFLQNSHNIPNWLHNASESHILKKTSENENITLIYFDSFWPSKARYLLINSIYWQDKDLNVHVVIRNATDEMITELPPISGIKQAVKISVLSAVWDIHPIANGWLEIEHHIIADPNGIIPYWLANRIALNSMWKTVNNITNQLPLSPSQNEKLTTVNEPKITIIN